MTNRRTFLKQAGLAGAGAVGASTLAAPYVKAQAPIKWRLQTYAGAPLGAFVIQPSIEAFNKAANGEMEIELYFADQLVPQGELFRAVQQGTLDAAQSDDNSMGSPADVAVFGAYFPFATLFSLDVPALFANYGLKEIWEEAYADTGVTWLGSGAWDPCNLGTTVPVEDPRRPAGQAHLHLPDRRPLPHPVRRRAGDAALGGRRGRDADRRARRHLVVRRDRDPLGRLVERAEVLPDQQHQRRLDRLLLRQLRALGRGARAPEAALPAQHGQLELLPPALVLVGRGALPHQRQARAHLDPGGGMGDGAEGRRGAFWDEIAAESERKAKVVQILKDYTAVMEKAGAPYRNA